VLPSFLLVQLVGLEVVAEKQELPIEALAVQRRQWLDMPGDARLEVVVHLSALACHLSVHCGVTGGVP
jgi:hypothetical protein